jgi:hypothetical protein
MNKPKTSTNIVLKRATYFFLILLFLFYSTFSATVYAGWKSGEIMNKIILPLNNKTKEIITSFNQFVLDYNSSNEIRDNLETVQYQKKVTPSPSQGRIQIKINPTTVPQKSSVNTNTNTNSDLFNQQKAANDKWFQEQKAANDAWYQQQTQQNSQQSQSQYNQDVQKMQQDYLQKAGPIMTQYQQMQPREIIVTGAP